MILFITWEAASIPAVLGTIIIDVTMVLFVFIGSSVLDIHITLSLNFSSLTYFLKALASGS